MEMLPEGCVSTILSLTSPLDASRASMVSSSFCSAADSDVVWDRFLPSDYSNLLSMLDFPFSFSSKKDLFFSLCNPLLIDDGHKSFQLEKTTGKISYILSARELSITWGDDPMCWSWKPVSDSRFSEVAELRTVSWLEIHGKIRTQMLSPNTIYSAYIIMKITDRAYGLDLMPTEMSVQLGNQISNGTAYLRSEDKKKQQMECLFYGNRMEKLRKRVTEGDLRAPQKREDGWMEVELGEFFNGDGGDEEVKMSLMEIKGYQLKAGLIVEGIEIRPKTLNFY